MGTLRRAIPLVTALVVLGSGLAAGQAAPGRSGFWGAAGLGAGGESYDLRDGLGYSASSIGPPFRSGLAVRSISKSGLAARC